MPEFPFNEIFQAVIWPACICTTECLTVTEGSNPKYIQYFNVSCEICKYKTHSLQTLTLKLELALLPPYFIKTQGCSTGFVLGLEKQSCRRMDRTMYFLTGWLKQIAKRHIFSLTSTLYPANAGVFFGGGYWYLSLILVLLLWYNKFDWNLICVAHNIKKNATSPPTYKSKFQDLFVIAFQWERSLICRPYWQDSVVLSVPFNSLQMTVTKMIHTSVLWSAASMIKGVFQQFSISYI